MRHNRSVFRASLLPAAWSLLLFTALSSGAAFGQQHQFRYTPPPDISVDGYRIDSLFMTVTYIIAGLFVLMTIILIAAAIIYRAKPGGRATYERGDSKKDAVKTLVISLAIFLGVDGTLLLYSHNDVNNVFWNFEEKPSEEAPLRVEVLAQQWAWNFRYAGKDGKFNTPDDIVTLNDFRVPEGKKVLIQLTSKDVIHSLFLPQCRIKRDANPGEITRLTFKLKEGVAGEYQIACAQMCGYAHYMMQGRFRVLTAQQWGEWYEEASRTSESWTNAQNTYETAHPELKARNNYAWGWEWKAEPVQ